MYRIYHHELYSHSQNKEHITKDPDHIPHLACFEFKIGASTRVLEHYNDQFKTLVEQNEQHIAVLQLQLCDTIVSLTNLEVTAARAAIASLYCKAVTALAIAFGLNASLDKTSTEQLIYFTFKDPTILKELTKHAGMTLDPTDLVTSFFGIFLQHNGHAYNHTTNKYSNDEYPPLKSTVGALINAIKGLFVNPWNTYFQAKLCQHQDAQICKYAESFHKECSTAAIAMAIESTAATSETISDFLDEKLAEEHKTFQATFNTLTQQICSHQQKNFRSGAHPSTQAKITWAPYQTYHRHWQDQIQLQSQEQSPYQK